MTMDPETVARALYGLAAFAALLVAFYGPWQWFCLDRARDTIFEQRDAFFDFAADGGLKFGSEEYEAIRSALNAMIRMAHWLTVWRILAMVMLLRGSDQAATRDGLRQMISRIDDERARDTAAKALQAAEAAVMGMIVQRSLPLLVVWGFLCISGRLSRYRPDIERRVRGPLESAIGDEVFHAS